jgi:hypothetical protein
MPDALDKRQGLAGQNVVAPPGVIRGAGVFVLSLIPVDIISWMEEWVGKDLHVDLGTMTIGQPLIEV